MGKCHIFCAGGFDKPALPVKENDHVIAADGGLRHLEKMGLAPHEILGDFDSLGYIPQNATVFPVEKDDTDSMLAVRRGLSLGYGEFYLYGCLDGSRLDHTLANCQTLQFLADRGAVGYLVGLDYIVTVIRGETVTFPRDSEGVLSLFCMGADTRGITLRGLKYPMENGVMTSGFPLGVSNHFTGEEATVTVTDGCLLALWDRRNGFPRRHSLKEVFGL